MQLQAYTFTLLDIQEHANHTKDALLTALEKEGLLKDTAENISSKYIVIIGKKNLFGKIFDKICGINDDKDYYQIVKTVE